MADFIHLHNHSDYSLLDAAQTVERMCNRVYDLGMDSIAITEHGNLFSMIPFYKKARESGNQDEIKEMVSSAKRANHTRRNSLRSQGGKINIWIQTPHAKVPEDHSCILYRCEFHCIYHDSNGNIQHCL